MTDVASAVRILGAREVRTAHFVIATTADHAQTRRVADGVEALHSAYSEMFHHTDGRAPMQLVLHGDQASFKRHNRSRRWAEAYYAKPASHAYVDADARNDTHWMLHEATHQLGRERADLPRVKWLDEGIASYFGASMLRNGRLRTGVPDPHAYPIWWLPGLGLTRDVDADVRAGKIVGLRALITDTGPPIAQSVNAYYISYWSLTHFLLHGEGGRHASAYREMAREGATLADFERRIGSVEHVQSRWHAHLRAQAARFAARDVVIVDEAP